MIGEVEHRRITMDMDISSRNAAGIFERHCLANSWNEARTPIQVCPMVRNHNRRMDMAIQGRPRGGFLTINLEDQIPQINFQRNRW